MNRTHLSVVSVLIVVTGLALYWSVWGFPFLSPAAPLAAEHQTFHATVAGCDKIVIRDGGYTCCGADIDKQEVLAVIENAEDISSLIRSIEFVEPKNPGLGPCECCGYPGIDFYESGDRVLITSIQHGIALRCRLAADHDLEFSKASVTAFARELAKHLPEGCLQEP